MFDFVVSKGQLGGISLPMNLRHQRSWSIQEKLCRRSPELPLPRHQTIASETTYLPKYRPTFLGVKQLQWNLGRFSPPCAAQVFLLPFSCLSTLLLHLTCCFWKSPSVQQHAAIRKISTGKNWTLNPFLPSCRPRQPRWLPVPRRKRPTNVD